MRRSRLWTLVEVPVWAIEKLVARISPEAALRSARRCEDRWNWRADMLWEDLKLMSGLALRCKEPAHASEAQVLHAISTWNLLRAPDPELLSRIERDVVGTLTEVAASGDPNQASHALYRLGQVYERWPSSGRGDEQYEAHQATALQYYERAALAEGRWAESAAAKAEAIGDPRVVLLTLYFENPASDASIAATLQHMGREDLLSSPYFGSPTEDGYQVQIFNHL